MEDMILIGVVAALVVVGLLVVRDTVRRRGRWGINLRKPSCASCGAELAAVRVPGSMRQMIWGGWTCPGCGQQLDKWGEVRS